MPILEDIFFAKICLLENSYVQDFFFGGEGVVLGIFLRCLFGFFLNEGNGQEWEEMNGGYFLLRSQGQNGDRDWEKETNLEAEVIKLSWMRHLEAQRIEELRGWKLYV